MYLEDSAGNDVREFGELNSATAVVGSSLSHNLKHIIVRHCTSVEGEGGLSFGGYPSPLFHAKNAPWKASSVSMVLIITAKRIHRTFEGGLLIWRKLQNKFTKHMKNYCWFDFGTLRYGCVNDYQWT